MGFDYVLHSKIQFDRFEREFSIYHCSSDGNYFITNEQVINRLSTQLLKLYNILDIQQSNDVEKPCCLEDLEANDDDIELVGNLFSESSCLNE